MNHHHRLIHIGLSVGLGIMGLTGTGCTKPLKSRIGTLEQERDALKGHIARLQDQLDLTDQERRALDARLLNAEQEADALRVQLASVREVPEPAAGWTAVPGGAMISIDVSVLFAPGKVTLRDQAKRSLDGIASTINGQYSDKDILVFGHTDDQPIKKSGWEDNWQLSAERALAVVRYLRARGIEASRLVAAGCGEYRPRVPNRNAGDRASNRRVEVFAIDPQARTGRP